MNPSILTNFHRQVTQYSSKYSSMKKKIFLVFFIAAFFACSLSLAQLRIGRHDESWKTIKTEHFDIIVSAQQQDLGLHYAYAAEKAYQNLSTVFTNLTEKIVLVVNDTTDVINGYATRIPYPHIMAYSVPTNEHDSLSEAGDWARELITHELTHILQFEPATGFYTFLRPIFGTIIAPNMLTPLWWKEGMAVEMETQFSPRGRLRSTYQDATIRSFVLENKLNMYDLPQANEVLPSWPYGSRPYLFGSLFFSQLSFDTKNIKSSGILANRQGELLPYFIEMPMYELTNGNYEMQYKAAIRNAEINSLEQIKVLQTVPTSEVYAIEQNNEASYQPSYSDKFKLLAYIENIEGKNFLAILDENNKKIERENLPSGQILSVDFHPTDKKILYTLIDQVDPQHTFSDLYIYDIEQDLVERISFSQRARGARYSDNGEQAVFVTTFSGQTQIRTIDLKTKEIKFVINSTFETRYESPIFWNEQTLLVSKIDPSGTCRLVKIDLKSQVESPVYLDFPQIRFLNKKNSSLYFVSSKNGANNIYVSKDLVQASPVTHVLSGIWSYDISADETNSWVSLMTGSGFKISKLKLNAFTQDLPVINNRIKNRYAYKETEYVYKKYPIDDYSASSYILPSYWIPFISTNSSSKGVFLQAQTTGHDPLNKHQYALAASYDSELNKGNFNGAYTNSTQKIPFVLSSIVQNRALGAAVDIVETTTHAASLLPDVFSINKNMTFQIGAQLQNTYFMTRSQHWGPFAQLSYKNYEQNIFQISPQSGWGGLLKFEKNYKLSDETDTAAQDYEKAFVSWIGFASPWLPKHHALKAKVSGLMTFSSVLPPFGSSSSSSFIENDGLAPQFVMRGYSPAQFFGRSMWNTNLEYRFPVSQLERGSGTNAYFLKRISGAVVADGIGVDGFGLAENLTYHSMKTNESIWNTGLELKLESTIGYILPMNFVLGYYFPHSPLFASSSQLGLSLQIGGF